MIGIPGFHCCGLGSVPGRGTEIPQAVQHSQKTKQNKTKTKEVSCTAAPAYCLETVSKYQSWKGDAAQVRPTQSIKEMGLRVSKTDEASPQGNLQKSRGRQQHTS